MAIIWLTGQPGSGKTTLCKQMMLNMGSDVFHIDGDDLMGLFDNKDYSGVGRRKNIELAQQISEYLHNKGKHVFVSLVSPCKEQRESFKEKLGDVIKEVYVYTSEVRGREQFFVQDYEPPTENYIDICTDNITVAECVEKIFKK